MRRRRVVTKGDAVRRRGDRGSASREERGLCEPAVLDPSTGSFVSYSCDLEPAAPSLYF